MERVNKISKGNLLLKVINKIKALHLQLKLVTQIYQGGNPIFINKEINNQKEESNTKREDKNNILLILCQIKNWNLLIGWGNHNINNQFITSIKSQAPIKVQVDSLINHNLI